MAKRKRSKAFPACFRYAKRHARKGHAAFDRALHACLGRSARYGAPAEVHAGRAKDRLWAIRDHTKRIREALSIGDCVRASGLLIGLAQIEGSYRSNRIDARGDRPGRVDLPSDRIYSKFTRVCIRPGIGGRR